MLLTTPKKLYPAKTVSQLDNPLTVSKRFLQLSPSNRPLKRLEKNLDRFYLPRLVSPRYRGNIYIYTELHLGFGDLFDRNEPYIDLSGSALFRPACSPVKRNRLASMILLASSRTQQRSKLCTIPVRCTCTHTYTQYISDI